MTKIFTLNSVAPEFLMDQLAEVREVDESSFGNFVGDVHDLLMILIQAMSPNDLQWLLTNEHCEKPDGSSTFNLIECLNSDQQPFFFIYKIQCHGQSWSVSGWPCHCDLKSAIFDPPCTWEKDGRGQSGPKPCFPINIDVIWGVTNFHDDSRVPGWPCHCDLILTSKSAIFDREGWQGVKVALILFSYKYRCDLSPQSVSVMIPGSPGDPAIVTCFWPH